MKTENNWLTIMGEVENESEKKVSVTGCVCELVETNSSKKSIPSDANEYAGSGVPGDFWLIDLD